MKEEEEVKEGGERVWCGPDNFERQGFVSYFRQKKTINLVVNSRREPSGHLADRNGSMWFWLNYRRSKPKAKVILELRGGTAPGPDNMPSAVWVYRFFERRPHLSLRTHLTQPLDQAFFGSIKILWDNAANHLIAETGNPVGLDTFAQVFQPDRAGAATQTNEAQSREFFSQRRWDRQLYSGPNSSCLSQQKLQNSRSLTSLCFPTNL
ncbi:hypothetical protein RRG08_036911 [Elysia crispata]|uniref:Uncharacterized protein n=1 Tax=Elysia crispata TaxID=231223 RepID=A0AAE1DGN4_9GAST|nr:hypothetical protein RRG08_036911 [Elysia crispata]